MMKKMLISLFLVVAFVSPAGAESSVWKAQKGDSVLYLGATCHVLRGSDYPLPEEFDRAYKASSVLVFETDLGKLEEPSTQLRLMGQGMYDDGTTIESHLSAEAYAELAAYCKARNISINTFKQFRPSLLMPILTSMELMKFGVGAKGVDMHYYGMAKKDGKTLGQLETVDEQMSYLLTMADGNENEFVINSLREMKDLKSEFDVLIKAWRAGDTAKLDELLISETKTKMPKLYKIILSDRNDRWIPQIEEFIKTPQVEFILVGAAHLVGPDGVVEQLRRKGWKVEKL